jgi:hypothetical protein
MTYIPGIAKYKVIYDSAAGLQYQFESGDITIPMSPANAITGLTGDVAAGTGPGAVASTLATVNSNVGSFTNANVTVNGKGLVTAASSGTAYSAGTGITFTSGVISQTVPSAVLPSVVDSTTYAVSGAAVIAILVPGLLSGSTIWSVSQKTVGGAGLPLLGYTHATNGRIDLTYSADPSTGVVVTVVFVA